MFEIVLASRSFLIFETLLFLKLDFVGAVSLAEVIHLNQDGAVRK